MRAETDSGQREVLRPGVMKSSLLAHAGFVYRSEGTRLVTDRDATEDVRHTATADGGVLETSLLLPVGLERVFPFFAAAENLETITPPELRFRIATPLPIAMRPGTEIDYTLRLWGVPFRWRTLISRWEPPLLFVDEQLAGPYRSWVHTHRFSDAGGGRTLITDEVRYTLPWPPLGRVARAAVARQVTRIFTYRQRRVRELLASAR
jgi:ligand-binding SRPBCC domain-containing protein